MRFHSTLAFVVAVFACVLLLSSCTKKAKIDLSGVSQNPTAGIGGGNGVNGGNGGDFIAGPTDIDGMGNGSVFGGDNDGDWDSTDKPVSGMTGEGSDFVKNGQRWDSVVYFGYDQSDIMASERAKLDTLGAYMNENPGLGLVIEGNTDEHGSDEYNRALGERRALAVQQYLGLLGVADNRMHTLSNGEDKPAVPNAATDADHQKNRRAEFVIGDLL